ncbi:MAG: aldose 1-epimerase family protein [Lachnospiraceae bacterium]|nr:aldose 1-epimerase family protein [Lachnospiraceae bacterium]
MAEYVIQNEFLQVTVSGHGAEMTSIYNRKNEKEYLWNGDSTYWGRHSPVLFPIVGSLKDKKYTFQKKEYTMGQHGFARDQEFILSHQTESELFFTLTENEETLKMYPFHFLLTVGYRLSGKQIEVIWNVENKDTKTMYFQIGAHPAFICPIDEEAEQTDCFLAFDNLSCLAVHKLDTSCGLMLPDVIHMPLQNEPGHETGYLPITEDLFDEDALILEDSQTRKVSLCSYDMRPYVSVEFGTPLFGIWSPAKKHAPFICIEPWYGRCDAKDFNGTIKDRAYMNVLQAKQAFHASYTIEIE